MSHEEHWERVYGAQNPTQVSWYAPSLERSLALIRSLAPPSAAIIDVGGGASTLVDDLLALGHTAVSVLDISSSAIAVSKERLGARAAAVEWIAGDITSSQLPSNAYDIWHDRALFHFLEEPTDRRAYADLATRCLKPGGHAIMATFSLEGPKRCSGLDIVRYSADALSRELGPSFNQKQETHETHRTPSGGVQNFMYCLFERV